MNLKEQFTQELTIEASMTRNMLAKVPSGRADYKPHAKSMSLARLATHIAESPGWVNMIVENAFWDIDQHEYKPGKCSSAEELLQLYETTITSALSALAVSSDDELQQVWSLRKGDHVFTEMPRHIAIRNYVLNHQVHHRAQLGVYLRLLDIPIPGMYGPSADEK